MDKTNSAKHHNTSNYYFCVSYTSSITRNTLNLLPNVIENTISKLVPVLKSFLFCVHGFTVLGKRDFIAFLFRYMEFIADM